MTMCTTMTTVNMVKRAIPTTRVRCGVAWKVRMRYSRGVVRRCMDNSSAKNPMVSMMLSHWRKLTRHTHLGVVLEGHMVAGRADPDPDQTIVRD